MYFLAMIIDTAVSIYIGIIVIQVALSWLLIFNVINADNPQAQNLIRLLAKATDPVYKPLRKYIPPIGGLDLTPIVVILGLSILRDFVIRLLI